MWPFSKKKVEEGRGQSFQSKAEKRVVYSNSDTFPTWTPINYESVANQGYKRNVHVLSGINKIAASFMEAPLTVWSEGGTRDGERLDNHPLNTVLQRPNQFMTQSDLWKATLLHLFICGNSFWEIVRNKKTGGVAELWPMRPDRIKIVPDPKDYVSGYIYVVDGKDVPMSTNEVIHFKFIDPTNDYWGMTPLEAAFKAVDVDNAMQEYQKVTLQNGGVPAFAVLVDSIPNEAHLDRLSSQFNRKYTGPRRETVGFFEHVNDIKPIGMSFNDMAFRDLDAVTSARVFQAIGVPPIVAGALVGLERSTYANTEQFRIILWQDVIEPLHKRIASITQHALKSDLGESNILAFDSSNVSALRTLHQSEVETARGEWNDGLITLNEFRRIRNLPKITNGDVLKTSFSTAYTPVSNGLDTDVHVEVTSDVDNQQTTKSAPVIEQQIKEHKRLERVGKNVYIANSEKRLITLDPVLASKYSKCARANAIKKNVQGLNALAGPLGRVGAAQKFAQEWRKWAIAENKYQIESIKEAIRIAASRKSLTQAQMDEAIIAMGNWSTHAQDGALPVISNIAVESSILAGAEMGVDIAFSLDNEATQAFIRSYSYKFAEKYTETSSKLIRSVLQEANEKSLTIAQINSKLDETLGDWEAYRVDRIARSEVIRSSNAATENAYLQAGITQEEWIASDAACPYCAALDGTVTSIGEPWFDLGERFVPEGEDLRPMKIDYEPIEYPPLHPNCECTIGAVI